MSIPSFADDATVYAITGTGHDAMNAPEPVNDDHHFFAKDFYQLHFWYLRPDLQCQIGIQKHLYLA